jgi:hypothetical protein
MTHASDPTKAHTPLTALLEIKGVDSPQDQAKRAALAQWVQAVKEHGGFGTWVVGRGGDRRARLGCSASSSSGLRAGRSQQTTPPQQQRHHMLGGAALVGGAEFRAAQYGANLYVKVGIGLGGSPDGKKQVGGV